MNWTTVIVILVVLGWFILPRLRWIPVKEAGTRLKEGALMLDVRSKGEFQGMKLPGSINIPVGSLKKEDLPAGRDILVYCASGMRSATAIRHLKSMGFVRVWNLGSYSRARSALGFSKNI